MNSKCFFILIVVNELHRTDCHTSKPWAVAKRFRQAVQPYVPTPSGFSDTLGVKTTPE